MSFSGAFVIQAQSAPKSIKVTSSELAEEAKIKRDQVPEFQFVRREAEKLGIRAWLFGGTASSYLYYVKTDLKRRKGDSRYRPQRFKYDFTDIFRSTQDLDIVVDADLPTIRLLEEIIRKEYPQFLGEKGAKWELRPLREEVGVPGQPGYKEALLKSFDFRNQHTDSNSVGLIELTTSAEPVVRDLRNWEKPLSQFLVDSAEDRITFLWSAKHKQTSRYKAGQNPEIFSVIRALTKSFQHEAGFDAESLARMKKIIKEWDPKSLSDRQEHHRLQEIGKKLFIHAIDVERAWDQTEALGLRKKLLAVPGKGEQDLSWWMNKEPLRSFPIGQGRGKTAADLGISIVAHETSDLLAYESITRDQTGRPNVFKSRHGEQGEAAMYGDGFYVAEGDIGARGTGINIKFVLNPKAREGTDFLYIPKKRYLVILNKNALQIIPESLDLSPTEYFKLLYQGKLIQSRNIALLEKFKRSMALKLVQLSPKERQELFKIVQNAIKSFNAEDMTDFLASKHPEYKKPRRRMRQHIPIPIEMDLKEARLTGRAQLVSDWMQLPISKEFPQVIQSLLTTNQDRFLATHVLSLPDWASPELFRLLAGRNRAVKEAVEFGLSSKPIASDPEIIRLIMNLRSHDLEIVRSGLPFLDPSLADKLLLEVLNRNSNDEDFCFKLARMSPRIKHKGTLEFLLDRPDAYIDAHLSFTLTLGQWKDSPELVEQFVRRSSSETAVNYLLASRYWRTNPAILSLVDGMNLGIPNYHNMKTALGLGRTLKDPESLKIVPPSYGKIANPSKVKDMLSEIFSAKYWLTVDSGTRRIPINRKVFDEIQEYRFPEVTRRLGEEIRAELKRLNSLYIPTPVELNYFEALLHSYLGLVGGKLDSGNQALLESVRAELGSLSVFNYPVFFETAAPEYLYLAKAKIQLQKISAGESVPPMEPPPILTKNSIRSCKALLQK